MNRARAVLALAVSALIALPLTLTAESAQATRSDSVPSIAGDSQALLGKGKAKLYALPGIAQPGKKPAKPSNQAVVSAKFTPARSGSNVAVQQKQGKAWKTIKKAKQDKSGSVAVSVKVGKTYRVVGSNQGKPVISNPVKTKKAKVTFEDTFSGTTLDPAKWRDQVIKYNQAGMRTCARPDSSQRSVGGGVVSLGIGYDPAMAGQQCAFSTPKLSGTTPYVLNSQIVTQDSYTFTHGIAAARVKFARPMGRHSGVWLAPVAHGFGPEMSRGSIEIDIAEFFGDSRKKRDSIASFLHAYTSPTAIRKTGGMFKSTSTMLASKKDTWWSSYHVVSVEWTAKGYVFRVDGKEYWRYGKDVSQAPAYVVLSALTSDYEIPKITPKNIGAKTQVDWVRVWAH